MRPVPRAPHTHAHEHPHEQQPSIRDDGDRGAFNLEREVAKLCYAHRARGTDRPHDARQPHALNHDLHRDQPALKAQRLEHRMLRMIELATSASTATRHPSLINVRELCILRGLFLAGRVNCLHSIGDRLSLPSPCMVPESTVSACTGKAFQC